ncbi:MAG: LysR family transcriptional regulator [Lachnospiraceae bacterium]|nr:LysR family transcriptional regulator [Lachnospiraceae bacterium]
MTLRHLSIFKMVCELGSITATADKLNMSQPAVSIAVRELEAFYNTKLFERMNRQIYVTETGNRLRQYADTILAQFDESIDVIRNSSASMTCRLGVNVTCAETYLSTWIHKIESEIDGIMLSIHVCNASEIERMIADNEIDIAIVDSIPGQTKFESRLLYSEKMCVVCSPNLYIDKMTIADLHTKPLLLREKGSGTRNSIDAAFFRHGLTPVPYTESISTLSLIRMVKNGLGYAILPRKIVEEELNSHVLSEIVIMDESFERYYHLVYHKNKYLTGIMKRVMTVLFPHS